MMAESHSQRDPVSGYPEIDPIHAISLASHLMTLYRTKTVADISVECEGQMFDLHTPILSHGSGYFREMLQDEDGEISLDFPVDAASFGILMESLYTGVVRGLTEKNVTTILEASYHLQISKAIETCVTFMMGHLSIDNCLLYWFSGKVCNNSTVQVAAIKLIGRHLDFVSGNEYFLGLHCDTIIEILKDDNLQVPSEETVYEAVMAWIKYDEDQRKDELCRLLKIVRMPMLSVVFLLGVVGKEDLIEENHRAMALYSKALKVKLGGQADDNGSENSRQRHNSMYAVKSSFEKSARQLKINQKNVKENQNMKMRALVENGENNCMGCFPSMKNCKKPSIEVPGNCLNTDGNLDNADEPCECKDMTCSQGDDPVGRSVRWFTSLFKKSDALEKVDESDEKVDESDEMKYDLSDHGDSAEGDLERFLLSSTSGQTLDDVTEVNEDDLSTLASALSAMKKNDIKARNAMDQVSEKGLVLGDDGNFLEIEGNIKETSNLKDEVNEEDAVNVPEEDLLGIGKD